MLNFRRRILFVWGLAIATLTPVVPTRAAEAVVRLASGRQFAGTIDGRAGAERLWLRTTYGGVTIRRPIAWDRVVAASLDGTELSVAAFRAAALAAAAEDSVVDSPLAAAVTFRGATPEPTPGPTSESVPPGPLVPDGRPASFPHLDGRVYSLGIDAWVANWDDDVEVDGLVLHVYPLAHGWRPTPVSGTLAVELFGERVQASARREAFPQLGRWSRAVHPADFGPAGAVYQLEFRNAHPEFDLGLAAHGLLRVQLTAPGHGTFEASLAELRVRPYSGVRDRMQQRRGRRFLPAERTGR